MEIKELVQETIAQMERFSKKESSQKSSSDEREFLEFILERAETLFLGLQNPSVVKMEDKLDLTLEFLEFLKDISKKRLDNIV